MLHPSSLIYLQCLVSCRYISSPKRQQDWVSTATPTISISTKFLDLRWAGPVALQSEKRLSRVEVLVFPSDFRLMIQNHESVIVSDDGDDGDDVNGEMMVIIHMMSDDNYGSSCGFNWIPSSTTGW